MSTGAGTDICALCGEAKEPTRRGSQNCRACDKSLRSPRARKFRLTLSVPQAVWDRLSSEAQTAGVSQYTMAVRVLSAWASASPSPSTSTKPQSLTDEKLSRAREWIAEQNLMIPAGITRRSELRAWLVERGYEFP